MERLHPITGLAMVGRPAATTTTTTKNQNRAPMVAAAVARPDAVPSYVYVPTPVAAFLHDLLEEDDQETRRLLIKCVLGFIQDNVPLPYPQDVIIYDSCPELVQKIKTFLVEFNITKAEFCRTGLGGVNSNSLRQFLLSKDQDQQANVTYRRAWIFFEKFRLYSGLPKSPRRLQNEIEYPQGFPTHRPRRMVRANPLGRDRYYNRFLFRL